MPANRVPTAFEERVYAAVKRIPPGRVATYAELARHLRVNAPRAVGQALKRNPHAPDVPCHRVIRTDGSLGGYQGSAGTPTKARLLQGEGVPLHAFRLADASRLFRFPGD